MITAAQAAEDSAAGYGFPPRLELERLARQDEQARSSGSAIRRWWRKRNSRFDQEKTVEIARGGIPRASSPGARDRREYSSCGPRSRPRRAVRARKRRRRAWNQAFSCLAPEHSGAI